MATKEEKKAAGPRPYDWLPARCLRPRSASLPPRLPQRDRARTLREAGEPTPSNSQFMGDKSELHRLVDDLPEAAEQPAVWLLQHLHRAGTLRSPQALAAAVVADPGNRFLRALAAASDDPHLQALADNPEDAFAKTCALAPYDDESLTPDDLASLQRAREDAAAGRVVSDEELRRQLFEP